jgi:polypeptide N-acetylgalactosaminyltransferase
MISKESYVYNQLNNQNSKFSSMMSRSRMNTCRIVLLTSLFWVFIDVFIIFYMTDCTNYCLQQQQQMYENKYNKHGNKDLIKDNSPNDLDVDYDHNLKQKNQRLHDLHKIKKEKNKAFREFDAARYIESSKKDDRANFLNKIKKWFREESDDEPKNPSHWPGENGRAVVIPNHLKKEAKERFKENQFNIVASDIMALNRSVPDQRSEAYPI